jgi:hypothetical protein
MMDEVSEECLSFRLLGLQGGCQQPSAIYFSILGTDIEVVARLTRVTKIAATIVLLPRSVNKGDCITAARSLKKVE